MKNQALFSSKDKSKKINVVCCNFCLALSLKVYSFVKSVIQIRKYKIAISCE